jgi:hypothetical protein
MTTFRLLRLASATLLLAAAACSSRVPVGDNSGGGGAGSGQGGEAGAMAQGGGGSTGTSSAEVAVRLRSSTAPFPHADGLAGQTPIAHSSGVRSLRLYRQEGDPDPFTVFDFGQESVEVDYADGADTLIYTAQASDLPLATFTQARVVHSYVRYRIAATMHYMGFVVPGEFDNMQVLSDQSLVDGQLRDAGYYEYVYTGASQMFPASGDDAPVPEWDSGGFSVRFEDGEWAYYFPVNLPVNPDLPVDIAVVLDVNMHESFRWMDQTMPNYMTGVLDVTPTTFEPVMKFGANSFGVAVE